MRVDGRITSKVVAADAAIQMTKHARVIGRNRPIGDVELHVTTVVRRSQASKQRTFAERNRLGHDRSKRRKPTDADLTARICKQRINFSGRKTSDVVSV